MADEEKKVEESEGEKTSSQGAEEQVESPQAEVPQEGSQDKAAEQTPSEQTEAVSVERGDEAVNAGESKTEGSDIADDTEEEGKSKRSIKQEGRRGWYVIHTYSGYEDQVAESLKQRIESMGMTGFIFNVTVPTEKQIEIKNGKRSVVEKKIFPGYVLVEMNVTDESWYVVRNTPNVTGFVGFGVRPTPMSEEEIARIQKRMSVQEPKHKIEFKIDDLVRINDGPLKGFEGKVTDIDEGKGKIKVSVNMFGRETPANIDFLQAKKV